MDQKQFELAVSLRGRSFQGNLAYYNFLSSVSPPIGEPEMEQLSQQYTLAVMNIGSPSCGMNAASRSFTRLALTRGCRVLGIRFGFEGLVQDNVVELDWDDVHGWTGLGGTRLGTTRGLPNEIGCDKVAEKFRKFKIQGLLIVGGFDAFDAVVMLAEARPSHAEFCIPMIIIPATISNNVPGTDFSLGSDTSLNEIADISDRIKQSASGTKTRVFVIETMGGYCGYLATMSALAGGADAAYIYEEPFTIEDLQADVAHVLAKIKHGVKRGLVLSNEKASQNYTSEFIDRLYSEEGKHEFRCRMNVLGHMQQGGKPSPFDRNLSTKLAAKAVEKLIQQIEDSKTPDGEIHTTSRDSATLLGLLKRQTVFTPVEHLKLRADFVHRIPMDNWWLELRPLLKILATHESVYGPGTSVTNAKDTAEKVSA